MIDFLFFLKTLALTIFFILLMQMEVGNRTIETHAMTWLHSSYVTEVINGVSRGGAKLVKDITNQVNGMIRKNVGKNTKEDERLKKQSPFKWTQSPKSDPPTEH